MKGFSFLVRAPRPQEQPLVRSVRPARSLGQLLGAGARARPGWAAACYPPASPPAASFPLLARCGVSGWHAGGQEGLPVWKPSHSSGPAWGRVLAGPAAAPAGWLRMEFGSGDTRARPWPWVCGGSWPSPCCSLSLSRGRPVAPALWPWECGVMESAHIWRELVSWVCEAFPGAFCGFDQASSLADGQSCSRCLRT